MSGSKSDAAPWNIKAMPKKSRELALTCATARGMTMATWLTHAIETQAAIDGGRQPKLPKPDRREQLPTVVEHSPPTQPLPQPPTQPPTQLDLTAVIRAVAEVNGGVLPEPLMREVVTTVRQQLRRARGAG